LSGSGEKEVIYNTVDGRNPAPVDMEDIRFFSNKQQVVQDFSQKLT